jgi:hypothetical protein
VVVGHQIARVPHGISVLLALGIWFSTLGAMGWVLHKEATAILQGRSGRDLATCVSSSAPSC